MNSFLKSSSVILFSAIALYACQVCETCTVYDANDVTVSIYDDLCTHEEREAGKTAASITATQVNGYYICE